MLKKPKVSFCLPPSIRRPAPLPPLLLLPDTEVPDGFELCEECGRFIKLERLSTHNLYLHPRKRDGYEFPLISNKIRDGEVEDAVLGGLRLEGWGSVGVLTADHYTPLDVDQEMLARIPPEVAAFYNPLVVSKGGNGMYRAIAKGLLGAERFHPQIRRSMLREMEDWEEELPMFMGAHGFNYAFLRVAVEEGTDGLSPMILFLVSEVILRPIHVYEGWGSGTPKHTRYSSNSHYQHKRPLCLFILGSHIAPLVPACDDVPVYPVTTIAFPFVKHKYRIKMRRRSRRVPPPPPPLPPRLRPKPPLMAPSLTKRVPFLMPAAVPAQPTKPPPVPPPMPPPPLPPCSMPTPGTVERVGLVMCGICWLLIPAKKFPSHYEENHGEVAESTAEDVAKKGISPDSSDSQKLKIRKEPRPTCCFWV